MNQIATCPNCQKQLTFDQASAGELWLCPACGAMLRLPVEPPSTALAPLPHEPPPTARPHQNAMFPWLILLGVIVLFQGIALLWYVLPRHASWEQLHRQEVYDLKTEAEGLAARGQPNRAYAKFRELEELVGGNPINDPALRSTIAVAAQEQNEMVDRILRQTLAARSTTRRSPQSATQPTETAQAPPPTPPVIAAPKPRRPNIQALPLEDAGLIDDDQIGHAIQNGAQYMLDRFKNYRLANASEYPDDEDALAVYALLQAYQATNDSRLDPRRPFMKQVLDTLKRLPMSDHAATYGRSLRASALQLGGRKEDLPALEFDLRWLLAAGPRGEFWYPMMHSQGFQPPNDPSQWPWDNSNSQYGLLGVWAAAEAGLPVPRNFWIVAQNHWLNSQRTDGQWTYRINDDTPTRSMTLAGLASLLVTQDYLNDSSSIPPNEAVAPALARGMAWLESDDNAVVPFYEPALAPGYTLYGLERVGLASGYKYFGAHDWYRESAANVVAVAQADGGWGDTRRTAFALLFLARGRHPIIMNKLRFADEQKDDHPRDVANLATYAGRTLERPVNWQVVPLSHDWGDWTDGPILFLSSHSAPAIHPLDEDKLRQFVLNGGLLLTQSSRGSDEMTKWAMDLGKRLFPPYQWGEIPADHPLWSVYLHLNERPHALAISNGARLLMVHLPQDLSRWWEVRSETSLTPTKPTTEPAYPTDPLAFGLDLFLYSTGKTGLRNRLVSTAIAPVDTPPASTITLAQLSVSPDSDPEPGAWPRFARWFRRRTDLAVNIVSGPLDQLPADAATAADGAPIAHLTGVNGFTATDAQAKALRDYVNNGGVVLIDPCGGPNEFLRSVREDLLAKAFPAIEPTRLDATHPLLTASGDGMSQLWPLELRDYVRSGQLLRNGSTSPIDRGIYLLRSGKGAVILSSLDVTSGLLGTNTWGIAGYTPDFCLALAKNFILWSWDGAKD